jgi:hypothetical protein
VVHRFEEPCRGWPVRMERLTLSQSSVCVGDPVVVIRRDEDDAWSHRIAVLRQPHSQPVAHIESSHQVLSEARGDVPHNENRYRETGWQRGEDLAQSSRPAP